MKSIFEKIDMLRNRKYNIYSPIRSLSLVFFKDCKYGLFTFRYKLIIKFSLFSSGSQFFLYSSNSFIYISIYFFIQQRCTNQFHNKIYMHISLLITKDQDRTFTKRKKIFKYCISLKLNQNLFVVKKNYSCRKII